MLILSLLFTISLVGCKSNGSNKENDKTSEQGLEAADNEFGLETVDVTDENGEVVTDKNGNPVTTEVAVEYSTDKNGNTIAKVLDKNGEVVTDKKGKEVTIKYKTSTTAKSKKKTTTDKADAPDKKATDKSTKATTVPTKGNEGTTAKEITTLPIDKDKVPTIKEAKNSSEKKAVTFSESDQQIVKEMLEVPELYNGSYDNAKGVPINIAAHAALWMAQRKGMNTKSYASGTIVLDLFKYFAQTVVNFKNQVNSDSDNDNLVYNANNDSFTISGFESKTHTVTIEKIEYLGNNNYYLVSGKVDYVKGSGKKNVYAIIQKNKLDATLGFSIKALEWS
ncbi:MAG: hypothetical protein IKF64_05490 [Eubacterium sp.]|nr:hypothetical protein [Eubacterium sp.]